MSGEQLERSILERKEREELKAIATAMSLEPVARTKKADLVDQILRAAGVEVKDSGNSNGAAPGASGSTRRTSVTPGSTAGAASAPEAAGTGTGSDAHAGPAAGDESPNGKVPRPRAARSRAVKPKADPVDTSGSADAPTVASNAVETDSGATTGNGTGAGNAGNSATPQIRQSAEDGAGGKPDAHADDGASPDGGAIPDRRPPRRSASASKRGAPSNGAGSLTEAPASGGTGLDVSTGSEVVSPPVPEHEHAAGPSGDAGAPPDTGAPADAGASAGGSAATTSASPGTDRSGPAGSYAPSQQRPQRQQQDRQQSDRQQSDRQQGHGPGNQGNQGNQSNQSNQSTQGGQQGEAGNRRGRRRRGREREPRGGELQGGAQPDSAWQGELVPVKGLVDLRDEGYGFLRTSGYLASSKDVYVSVNQARRFALRRGDALEGACRPAGPSEKYPALLRIDTVNGMSPEEARERPRFEDLTPLFPDERLRLESSSDPSNVTARIIDLISPIGKGQRGMIVSPSKAGKTTIMKQIAHSVELNNPDVHLMVLLVDERPEEVTDMRRSVKGEVIASTFDRPADEHTALSELTMERAKRLVEMGQDVVIILDGITRLARAYNLAQPATGRIMSGGVDSGALYPPKKFFGAARNVEEGGSLTILATALIETGSKMDEVIFEEFKGTGNMELRLDRKLAERRIYPAIDVNASSTRHEELLFDRSQLQQVWKLRRVLNALGAEGSAAAGLELLMDKIKTTRSNDEFLAEIAKAPTPSN